MTFIEGVQLGDFGKLSHLRHPTGILLYLKNTSWEALDCRFVKLPNYKPRF